MEKLMLPPVSISAKEKRLLEKRAAEVEAGECVPWEDVKASLEAKRK